MRTRGAPMSLTGSVAASPAAGSIVFTGCAMMPGARDSDRASLSAAAEDRATGAAHPQHRRREVVVAGKRVKTVDVHAHCCVPQAMALIKHLLEAPGLLMNDTSARIAAMDAQGIDVEALSINPYWYR